MELLTEVEESRIVRYLASTPAGRALEACTEGPSRGKCSDCPANITGEFEEFDPEHPPCGFAFGDNDSI